MRIKILTIQYAHNYGAVLQAYSLKTYLENLGNKVEIVNYVPFSEKYKYSLKLKNQLGKKEAIRHLRIFEWIKNEIDIRKAQPEWEIRYNKFKDFIDKMLIAEKEEVEDVADINKDVDAFICGSDQIWNPVIVGDENPFYFLDFPTKAKKISYAASMGNPKPCYSKDFIRNTLSGFNAISVREDELKDLLENYYQIESVKVVCDPCLLLEKKDYLPLITNNKMESLPFICVYYINDSGALHHSFKDIDVLGDKQIVEIRWIRNFGTYNKNQRTGLSVYEFLWYINNCEVLYTDSFHGTIFSLIFHKNFWVVSENNIRIESLLSKVGLKHRIVNSIAECNENMDIDWEKVDEAIDTIRENSRKFLLNSLYDAEV